MTQGKSIVELATEIERQRDSKRDYIADTRALSMDSRHLVFGGDNYEMTDHAKRQLATELEDAASEAESVEFPGMFG